MFRRELSFVFALLVLGLFVVPGVLGFSINVVSKPYHEIQMTVAEDSSSYKALDMFKGETDKYGMVSFDYSTQLESLRLYVKSTFAGDEFYFGSTVVGTGEGDITIGAHPTNWDPEEHLPKPELVEEVVEEVAEDASEEDSETDEESADEVAEDSVEGEAAGLTGRAVDINLGENTNVVVYVILGIIVLAVVLLVVSKFMVHRQMDQPAATTGQAIAPPGKNKKASESDVKTVPSSGNKAFLNKYRDSLGEGSPGPQ